MILRSFLNSYLTLFLFCISNINYALQTDKNLQSAQNHQAKSFNKINYYLKWVFIDYILPIWLEEPFDNSNKNNLKSWYKYSNKAFIDQLENQEAFAFSSTAEHNRLYILNYDFNTHDQLSSYESKQKGVDSSLIKANMKEPVRNIFTLAFLKSHIIIFENVNEDQADISCAVVIFLPVNEDNYNITIKNYDLIDQSININLELNEGLKKSTAKSGASIDYDAYEINDLVNQGKNFNRRKKRSSQYLLEIELRQGPITVMKSEFENQNISCHLSLVDFDDSYAYENLITKKFESSKITKAIATNHSVDDNFSGNSSKDAEKWLQPKSMSSSISMKSINSFLVLSVCFNLMFLL